MSVIVRFEGYLMSVIGLLNVGYRLLDKYAVTLYNHRYILTITGVWLYD